MIPQPETLEMEEPEPTFSTQQFESNATGEEGSMGIKGLEDLEERLDQEPQKPDQRRNWVLPSRFATLVSIIVVVLAALIVFLIVMREEEAPKEVVIIKEIQPMVETEPETSLPPVGARLEEAPPPSREVQPVIPETTPKEPMAQVPSEPVAEEQTEVTAGGKEQEVVASIMEKPQPAKKPPPTRTMPPAGAYTVNVASFRSKEGALRYVEQLKAMGLDAFDWEIDIPQKGRWYRVSVGDFPTREKAQNYADELKQKGMSGMFIIQIPEAS
jgi:cell division septation protein DedD